MVQFIIIKGSGQNGWDATELVEKVTWGGRKGSAPRSLKISMADDDNGHERVSVDCENGDQCVFYEDGKELFRGIIVEHTQGNSKKISLTAYDNMFYLANNKDSFCYTNMTANQIFEDAMSRIGMTGGEVVNTEYVIPELPKAKTTYWDVLQDALSSTYKATGIRYYILSKTGEIHLRRRSENTLQWVLEIGSNITDYSYSKNISKVKTRVRLLSKEDAVVYEQVNEELENRIGTFMEVKSVNDSYNDAQIQELVQSVLEESGAPSRSLKVSGLGITEAIAGGCVYVIIPHLNIQRTFYIDEDTHDFTMNSHKMSITLNFATDIESAG